MNCNTTHYRANSSSVPGDPTFGDTEFEHDEQIRLTVLQSDLPGFEEQLYAFGTILNDDQGTLVSVGDASVLEGGEGEEQFALFTVTLSGALPTEPLRVLYQTADGEAQRFEDYEPVFGTLEFAPGETEKTVEVRVFGDFEREGDERFFLQLFDPSLPNTLTGPQGVGTIQDDDGPQVFISGGTVLEGDAGLRTIQFEVFLEGDQFESEAQIAFSTVDGGAIAGEDYVAQSGVITFMPGENQALIEIQVIGDDLEEADESFFVRLEPVPGFEVVFANDTGEGLILDDDGPARLLIGDVVLEEGGLVWDPEFFLQVASFTVSLRGEVSGPVTVDFATSDGTASGALWDGTLPGPAGADYAATGGTLSFAPGETSKTIEVLIRPDVSFEPDETFFVTLSNAVGAAISDGEGAGTILNDDELPQISISGATVSDDADTSALFTVQLSAPTDVPVTVQYASVDGSATALADYGAVSGTLTIAAGELTGVIVVPIIGDAEFEAVESFSVVLGSSTNAVVVQSEALGIIDDRPTLSVGDVSVAEGDEGEVNTALFTLRLSKPVPVEVAASFFTEGDTAQPFSDFGYVSGQIVFAAGETEQMVAVEIVGDGQFEFDERFRLQLYDLVNARLPADFEASAAIVNDDAGWVFSVSDAEVPEYGGFASFTVTLTAVGTPPDDLVSVFYETQDLGASAFEDYLPVSDVLTFFPGETEKTIQVMVFDDGQFEGDEEFVLTFSDQEGQAGLLFARSQGMATIVDDDPPPPPPTPEVFIFDAVSFEGNDEGGVLQFTVSLIDPLFDGEVRIAFSTADGSALAGEDYVAASGELFFMPGEIGQVIQIQLIGDALIEPDEFFSVHLSPVLDPEFEVIFANDQALGTILDDDAPARLSISDAQVFEGDTTLEEVVQQVLGDPFLQEQLMELLQNIPPEQRGQAVFELLQQFGVDVSMAVFDVALSGGNGATTVTVDYATADGTAQGVLWDLSDLESVLFPPSAGPDQDYIATSGTLSFAPGQRHQSVLVLISPDRELEFDESFFVELSGAQGAEIVDGQGEGTILTDDGMRIFGTQVREEDGVAVFSVVLSSALGTAVSVDYASADGSAVAGEDYAAVAGTLSFAPGETLKLIEVPVLADGASEGFEEFFVALTNASGAPLVGGGLAQATISDFPRLSVADASVLEGDSGISTMVFTLSASAPTPVDVEVGYRVMGITAEEGSDFEPVFDFAILRAGETSVQIAVSVYGDLVFEADEQVLLEAFAFTSGFEDEVLSAVGTIVNDDAGFLADAVNVAEGDAGVSFAVFTVRLSEPVAETVTLDYATEDATAQAGSDYAAVSGTLVFAAGETEQTISVPVLGDTGFEPDEYFWLRLSNPVNAGLPQGGDALVLGSIINDDAGIVLGDAFVTEGDNGYRAAVFTISLQGAAPGATASVHFSTADGSATAGADYVPLSGTITFEPGETLKQFTIPVRGDLLPESDEHFVVWLSDAVGAAIATEAAVALVHDNDPGLQISDAMAFEFDSAIFTVTLTSPLPEQEVWVDFYTLDGTAQGGVDYQPMSGSLYFAPGQTVQYVMVPLYDDFSYELDETFSVRLANSAGAAISREEGVGTILNDDTQPALEFFTEEFVFEGDDGTTELAVRVQLTAPTGVPVSVDYATGDANAIGGQDYVALTGTLTFQPGEMEQFVRLEILGGRLFETEESFGLSFSNPVNAAGFVNGNQVAVTIFDNDARPFLNVSSVTLAEGGAGTTTDAAFVLSLSAASGAPATVEFAASSGTAAAGIDFLPAAGSITFDPGETEKVVVVSIAGDGNLELDEYFYLDVFNAQNVDLTGFSYGTAHILNDDPLVLSLDQAGYAVDEGSALSFQARIEDSELPQDFVAFSLEGYPSGASIDFFTGAFSWVPGEDQGPGVYTFDVVASVYPLGLVDRETVTVTVNEVEGTQVFVSIGNASVAEGDSGTSLMTFNVWLDAPAAAPVSVDFFTGPGTATEFVDYAGANGQVVFAPGESFATISVMVHGDTAQEADETLFVSLVNAVNAVIHPLQGYGTGFIINDDLPRFAINDVSVFEGGEGGTTTATFTVALLGDSLAENSLVGFSVFGGSASPGLDFVPSTNTLFFGPGQTSLDITVTVNGDAAIEGDESFFVQLFAVSNALIVDGIGSGTIRDDDSLPPGSLLVNDVTAFEGTGAAAGATFTVLRARGDTIGATSTVQYSVSGGTASPGSDFLPFGGTLVFGPGEMFQTFTIELNPDAQLEEDETFTVQLFAPSGAVILDGQGTGTILNDDTAADSAPLAADGVPPEVEIAWTDAGEWDPAFSPSAGGNFAEFDLASV